MRKWTIDQWSDFSDGAGLNGDWTCDKKKNPYLTDTAGFKPLEAQIAQFEQAGLRARYRSDMFDSSDYNEMFLHPDLRINSEDDEIDIENKISKQNFLKLQIAKQKAEYGDRQSFESIMKEYAELKRREAERKQSINKNDAPKQPAVGAES